MTLLPVRCVTVDKLLLFSEPLLPHLQRQAISPPSTRTERDTPGDRARPASALHAESVQSSCSKSMELS